MNIGWSDDLGTGVAGIDNQHKELFRRVESLSAACGEGKGKEELLRLFQFLEDYVKEHFAAEERLQVRHAYPGYAVHKAQHAHFIAEVARLAGELKADGATLPLVIRTNQALASWLVQHIKKADTELAGYLREQGV